MPNELVFAVGGLVVGVVAGVLLVKAFLRRGPRTTVEVQIDATGKVIDPLPMVIEGIVPVQWNVTNNSNAPLVVSMRRFQKKRSDGTLDNPTPIFAPPEPTSGPINGSGGTGTIPATVLQRPKLYDSVFYKYEIWTGPPGGQLTLNRDPEIEMYDKN